MNKYYLNIFLAVSLACGLSLNVFGAIDAYEFSDPELQQRHQALVDELRCPQCLNTNLSGSDSMIAQDLRREIHRMVQDGKSDDDIRQFMYERYGDFILYKPRVNNKTMFLWFGPGLLLILGIWFVHRIIYRTREIKEVSLSAEDSQRLKDILEQPNKNS